MNIIMSSTPEMLWHYLREAFYDASKAVLDIDKLDEEYHMLGKGLVDFAQCVSQHNAYAKALAKGDLRVTPPPPANALAGPLKSLHTSLKHLTWQSQQVAKGDYKQRVAFMGEFSDAFNMMVTQLAERREKLQRTIEESNKHVKALEQSNQLLSNITQYITQQLFVIDADKHEILLVNCVAEREMENDADYYTMLIDTIVKNMPEYTEENENYHVEIPYNIDNIERHLSINSYYIEWGTLNAVALVIDDISSKKKKIKELENYAYRDALTHLYNRFYGMLVLHKWLDAKRRFVLVFIDLDNLKYINDKYGHNEGDIYIITAAKHIKAFSQNAVACRLGGDEFMLLISEAVADEIHSLMVAMQDAIQHDPYLHDKDYFYSLSFGVVAVEEDNRLPSSEILSQADERMYEYKRARKKERRTLA